MAGHSKWANIQHRKGAQDAKRSKLFTRLIREITVAARFGGEDPGGNPRLRTAVDKGLAANMPKDTIERAIKRGAGSQESDLYEEVRYEGYGAGGVAVMVDCLTDNRNRTVSDVRHAFTKCQGNLGTDGSVAYMFNKVGQISYPQGTDEDRVMEVTLESGAEDIVHNEDGSFEVLTTPEMFETVKNSLESANLIPEQAEVTMRATTNITVNLENAQQMIRLLEMLEELDDVQQVYSNAEIPDEIMTQLS